MREYFEEQLKRRDEKPLTEDQEKEAQGRSYYGRYEAGDVMLVFMEQTRKPSDKPIYNEEITLKLYTLVERDIDKLLKEFSFVRMATGNIPVLEKKK